MFRRSLLASALLPLLPSLAMAQAGGDRAATLARIEAYLNGLTTLRARFLQIASNGGSAEGTAMIWRPGRMRFEYDPPEPLLLVASDGQFLHYDKELHQPSIVPVSSTPLGFLLRPQIRFTGDLEVTALERGGGLLRVTMRRREAPGEGSLTLVFAEDPMELRQWVVVDAQGQQTRVTLTQIQTGVRFDPLVFAFNDPRFFEQQVR
ncbi:LolA family protein [Roseomonas marmotae]|uniref:Outer membrane lipoprotein carrier protein LolA n=1 Tax=Roseomonas marmotae TaxID=2768161 RepID=A0ABS3K6C8_9PROT|nr:outer membrane lipoprotein carrier protein LolA [Roseomonas marmotae]MBO1073004.1 outer membrane lipoprotein carrier protein LolA [Roseomonas marmotae]QTI79348.1 outer membrane lipoprotein carrier protein LolA [Roseomonas marmotae]